MTDHLHTPVYTEEEARKHLQALNAEIAEVVARYGLHSFIFVASASTPPKNGELHPDALATSLIDGCFEHGMSFLARFLVFAFSTKDFGRFLDFVLNAQNFKKTVELATKDSPTSEDALAQMPVSGGGKVWQN